MWVRCKLVISAAFFHTLHRIQAATARDPDRHIALRCPRCSTNSKQQQADHAEPEAAAAAAGTYGGSGGGGGEGAWQDGDGDPCPLCGGLYSSTEFWIACDFCDTWYCGKCVRMTEQKAQKVKRFKCPSCEDG